MSDPTTAWRTQAFGDARGQRIEVDLDGTITTDHVNLVQPLNGGRDRYITNAVLTFDGGHPVNVTFNGAVACPDRPDDHLPRRTFHSLSIRVVQVNDHRPNLFGQSDPVGFAEIRLHDRGASHDVRLDEIEQMPSDLLDALGSASAGHPLVLVMSRDATRPTPPRGQPEWSISRTFTLPTRGRST